MSRLGISQFWRGSESMFLRLVTAAGVCGCAAAAGVDGTSSLMALGSVGWPSIS